MIVVGNPENRRVEMFCAAVRRLDLPQPQVISYEAILTGKIDLARLSVPGCLVRIDSPGENEAVHRSLIARARPSRSMEYPRTTKRTSLRSSAESITPGSGTEASAACWASWNRRRPSSPSLG